VIPSGLVTVRGFAYDESDVPHIILEARADGGSTHTIQCPQVTAGDGHWQCAWDAGAADDGDIFELRAQAVDEFGQSSGWSEWITVVVDTTPPTVTVEPGVDGETLGAGIHSLHGLVADNQAGASVQVCVPDGDCVTIAGQPAQEADVVRWAAHLPAPGTATPDRLQQTIEVYGIDAVGNRSPVPVTITYWLDSTPPALNVSNVVLPLSGTASDGSAFDVYVRVTPPSGLPYRMKPNKHDGNWTFTPSWDISGVYRLWVQALDIAGNITTSGPYQVQFDVDVFWYLYFPYVLN
jgi:hypothetical protein